MKLLPTKDLLQAALVSIVQLGQIAWISVFLRGRGWAELHSRSLQSISSLHFVPVEPVTFLRAWVHRKQVRFQPYVWYSKNCDLRRNDASQWHWFLSLNGNRKGELTWGHLLTGTRDFVACNHLRSYKYYSDSIIYPDGFLGYPCASYELFQSVSISQSLGMDHTENNDPYLCIWNSIYLC